ncbi:hypothetical protein [Staphylococcus coagulans]|uniref:hypothetical protein n=1 Tax=Staphylococcus coagulans TaxID=74706 RepID=UPI001F4BEF37|nr:hypothetical protein [Staphylococcus coagulans]UNB46770.1 hypothetical protein KM141_02940 [Staphylococcus coagulans]
MHRINLRFDDDDLFYLLKKKCKSNGLTMNRYINMLIIDDIKTEKIVKMENDFKNFSQNLEVILEKQIQLLSNLNTWHQINGQMLKEILEEEI